MLIIKKNFSVVIEREDFVLRQVYFIYGLNKPPINFSCENFRVHCCDHGRRMGENETKIMFVMPFNKRFYDNLVLTQALFFVPFQKIMNLEKSGPLRYWKTITKVSKNANLLLSLDSQNRVNLKLTWHCKINPPK